MVPSKYSFADYSNTWPSEFMREAGLLRELLGDGIVAIHHIGSTSVPGLAAKPTIDMLPVVRDLVTLDGHTSVLENAGYRAWGEYGLPRRRFYTRDVDGYRTHNIHFWQEQDQEIERHLAFCAYLRAHPAARSEYEALKREVYARHPADVEAYCDSKNAWIKVIEPLAIQWYRGRTHAAMTSNK